MSEDNRYGLRSPRFRAVQTFAALSGQWQWYHTQRYSKAKGWGYQVCPCGEVMRLAEVRYPVYSGYKCPCGRRWLNEADRREEDGEWEYRYRWTRTEDEVRAGRL